MTNSKFSFLVFGGTGRTGRHFISLALNDGHKVRALVRNPDKIEIQNPNLELVKGSITDYDKLDELLNGIDFVISMLGDAQSQRKEKVNTLFVKQLILAMRRQGVKRFLYQAGSLTRAYKEKLSFIFWFIRNTLARFSGLIGQHKDNEAVIEYLVEEAQDIEWMVHRAGINPKANSSKGLLQRSKTKFSMASFEDTANYNYRLLTDNSAVHSYDLSCYGINTATS